MERGLRRQYNVARCRLTSQKKSFEEEMATLNAYLEKNGPLFGGDRINATDCLLAPRLYHASVVLKHFQGYDIPESMGAIHKYLEEVCGTPGQSLGVFRFEQRGLDAEIACEDRLSSNEPQLDGALPVLFLSCGFSCTLDFSFAISQCRNPESAFCSFST